MLQLFQLVDPLQWIIKIISKYENKCFRGNKEIELAFVDIAIFYINVH